jgi:8-hydroxy-5-deazaflavin:NADPH oxidoreductase
MKIGIIGAGHLGATLARKLVAAGHDVKLAASKGPDAVRDRATELGAVPVASAQAVQDVDAVIVSIPLANIPDLAPVLAAVPPEVPVIDTSNYYPMRDGAISALDGGMPESVWVSEQLGRPVIKAFNAVLAHTLAARGQPTGTAGRLAIPVAGDDPRGKAVAMALVDAAGFDALDAGDLAGSWRQQPGTPAYCTELTVEELRPALDAADQARAPAHREALIQEFIARGDTATHEDMVARNRAVTAPR